MQSGLFFFSRPQIPCVPLCTNFCFPRIRVRFRDLLETLRVFLPCRTPNLGACHPFFSRHNSGSAPQFASPENNPLTWPLHPRFRSRAPCMTRHFLQLSGVPLVPSSESVPAFPDHWSMSRSFPLVREFCLFSTIFLCSCTFEL